MTSSTFEIESPFHAGEQRIQTRLGVRENMERFGRMVIRDHMPEQHIEFYEQLAFVFVGHADPEGYPWASIVFNGPGFITSPDNQLLEINASPVKGDPLNKTLITNNLLGKQTRLGILGIELASRRRNRLAGHVEHFSSNKISLNIDQSFGNCPQYIQSRDYEIISKAKDETINVNDFVELTAKDRQLIEEADTFFIASYIESEFGKASDGADVSHRGGRAGFVRVNDPRSITFPDYLGNNHFNTLGNISENGKAGLLFIDFENGHLLSLTGTASIVWDSAQLKHFDGAQRLIDFTIERGVRIENAVPIRWSNHQYSSNSLLTGTWNDAEKNQLAETKKNQWLRYKIQDIIDESQDIRSFYLMNEDGENARFKPGQYLTLKADINGKEHIRTYTVSSAPDDQFFRISVKREIAAIKGLADGVFSTYLHEQIEVNSFIDVMAPRGNFYFDTSKKSPAVLMAAGIGITPMVAILRQSIIELTKTRTMRPLVLIAVARNKHERAFYVELNNIIKQSRHQIKIFWFLTHPEDELQPDIENFYCGRPNQQILSELISDTGADAYVCGPETFMQSSYDNLRSIGIKNENIYAESFGPSSLKRDIEQDVKNYATQALISVENNNEEVIAEQQWTQEDGSLLEFIESHGMSPSFSCRSGRCGACKSTLATGKVEHFLSTAIELNDDELLLCCAKPAATNDAVEKITIRLP